MKTINHGLYAPIGGWKPHAYYLVELKVISNNPTWRTLLYTGFIDSTGIPAAYGGFIQHAQGEPDISFLKIYYLKPLHLLARDIECELQAMPTNKVEVEPFTMPSRARRDRKISEYWKKHYKGEKDE